MAEPVLTLVTSTEPEVVRLRRENAHKDSVIAALLAAVGELQVTLKDIAHERPAEKRTA